MALTALGGLILQGGPPAKPDDMKTALRRQTAAVAGGGASAADLLGDGAGSLVQQDPRYQENARLLLGLTTGGSQSEDRIWGGLPTMGYRKVVAIKTADDRLCTGVIISPNTVLTAAHCVCPGVSAVDEANGDLDHLAARHLLAANQPSKPTMRDCHAPASTPADIGLIRINDSFAPDDPVVFAATLAINGAPFIRAVGFGLNENGVAGIKEYVDIPVASSNCGGVVSSQPDSSRYGCTPTFELVAGQSHLNRDTCHGDSGGPVFLHVDDGAGSYKEYLAGITSRGIQRPGFRECGDGGVYTRVDREILQYIKEQGVAVQVQGH